jgi:hypothetical protein
MVPAMHYQLKIELAGLEPSIWRRVIIPADYTLNDLHAVVQVVLGWDNEHLHEFQIKRQKYSLDTYYGGLDECEAVLREVVKPRSKFEYIYDLGDCWTHEIVVEARIDHETTTPICVGGKRAGPPEGCGGPWGFANALELLSSGSEDSTSEAMELLGESFDPNAFDLNKANRRLGAMFRPADSQARASKRAAARAAKRSR